MVLDSSAIVAIHLREPGHDRLIEALENAEVLLTGAPTLLETAMMLTARLGQVRVRYSSHFFAVWRLR